MYEITLEALKSANNERLWFNTNQKLAKLYLDTKRFKDVEKIISTLKLSCQSEDGVDDQSKGSYLLEVVYPLLRSFDALFPSFLLISRALYSTFCIDFGSRVQTSPRLPSKSM